MLEGAKQEGTSDVAYSRNQPPPYWKTTKNHAAATHGAINPAPSNIRQTCYPRLSNPKRIAEFRRSQVCDSRPRRCTGQMTPWNSADDGAGALFASTRVQNRRREPAGMATQRCPTRTHRRNPTRLEGRSADKGGLASPRSSERFASELRRSLRAT